MRSPLPPSTAARRMACPGSRALEAELGVFTPSQSAREGIAAHYVAMKLLKERVTSSNDVSAITVGEQTPAGDIITDEMVMCADIYVNAITDCVLDFGVDRDDHIHIEETIDITSVHKSMYGIIDCWVYCDSTNTAHIFDYKYGHRPVNVKRNWQLIAYAAGVLQIHRDANVVFHIVQPRSYNPNGPLHSWAPSQAELAEHIGVLRLSEHISMQDNAPIIPGAHCGFCSARHACGVLQVTALNVAEATELYPNKELNPPELSRELHYLMSASEILNARISGLSEQATAMLNNGAKLPHFMLQASAGREVWKKPAEEIIALGEMFNVNLAKPRDVITPKQALTAGIPKEILSRYADKKSGGFKLTAIDYDAIQDLFKNAIDNTVNKL